MAKSRKRKRLQELAAETEGSPFMTYKRRSSSADISGTSMSPNSFLDLTYTPDKSDQHLSKKTRIMFNSFSLLMLGLRIVCFLSVPGI